MSQPVTSAVAKAAIATAMKKAFESILFLFLWREMCVVTNV